VKNLWQDSPVSLKTVQKNSYHHGDLANSLVEAAIDLVKKHGPDNLSLRAVSAAVGVSPSACYHYFPDKTSLVTAVGKALFQDLADRQERAVQKINGNDSKAAIERFQELGKSYFEWALAEPNLYRLIYGGFCAPNFENHDSKAWKLLEKSLDELVSYGVITTTARENGEAFVWASVHGASSLIIEGHMPKEAYSLILTRVRSSLGID